MEKSEASEWDIFKRIEKLEKLELSVKEVSILAAFAFMLGFFAQAKVASNPRKLKDDWVAYLQKQGLHTNTLKGIEKRLLWLCELIEEG